MSTFKYVLKRIGLMLVTAFIIMTICFVLIKLLEPELPMMGNQAEAERARREALGWNKPIMVQYAIYLKNIFTKWDWGTSWKIDYFQPAASVIIKRLPPTVIINSLELLISIPVGIILGVFAAIKKNKWQDHLISIIIMLFISVPVFVYAFLLQYLLGFKLGWFPLIMSSLYDAGGKWFSKVMLKSMVLPVLSLSFGSIAGLTRMTRAELTEALTSDYMLLARTKGLTKSQAISRHAMKNAMVPILPRILGMILGILGGAMLTETIFGINGIGKLYLQSITTLDYDVFMATSMFYCIIGLASTIVIDLSYGFLDPRIRMGER
ncbi:MAG: ABC transporter permease [Clostridia bacterium]|nr:ABC transporter permease [Clostridia bacterium]